MIRNTVGEKMMTIKTWEEAGNAIEQYRIALEPVDAIGTGYNWIASLPPIIDCDMPWATGETPIMAIEKLLNLLSEKNNLGQNLGQRQ